MGNRMAHGMENTMVRLIGLAAALILLAGCGGKKTTSVVTPGGTVTSTEDASGKTTTEYKGEHGELTTETTEQGSTAQIKDKEGNVTNVETGRGVDLAKAGIAIYPGASIDDEGKAAATATTGQSTITAAGMTTSDPPSKVLAWYEKQLKGAQKVTAPEGGMVMGQNDAGDKVIVTVGVEEGKTQIGVQVHKGE